MTAFGIETEMETSADMYNTCFYHKEQSRHGVCMYKPVLVYLEHAHCHVDMSTHAIEQEKCKVASLRCVIPVE